MRVIVSAVLWAVFFGLLTPAAWVLRAFRYDILDLKRAKTKRTYWIARAHSPSADSFTTQRCSK